MTVIYCWLYYTVHILYHTNHKCVSYGYHCIITSQNIITNRKCLNGDAFSPCDCTWVVSAISRLLVWSSLNYEDVALWTMKMLCTKICALTWDFVKNVTTKMQQDTVAVWFAWRLPRDLSCLGCISPSYLEKGEKMWKARSKFTFSMLWRDAAMSFWSNSIFVCGLS